MSMNRDPDAPQGSADTGGDRPEDDATASRQYPYDDAGTPDRPDAPASENAAAEDTATQPRHEEGWRSAPPPSNRAAAIAGRFSRQAPRQRLTDTAEKLAYLTALIVVSSAILIGKSAGWLGPWPAAVLAVVAIVAYAAFAWTSQRENPVRADRLGDNCYYLGLVYTLASLIASLIVINRGANVNDLLGNFGVALVSTAAGIVARLILIQLRAESDDIDQRARLALADTANAMQSDLLLAASTFRSLMIDAQESFRVSVERTRQSVDQSAELAERLQSLELSPEVMNNGLVGVVKNIERAAEAIAEAGDKVREQSRAIGSTADAVQRADTGMTHIQAVLEQVAATLEKHRVATEKVIAAMEAQTSRSEAYARRLEKNAEEARIATEKVYSALGDLSNSIISQLKR